MKLDPDAILHATQVGMRSGTTVPLRLGTRIIVHEETRSTNDDIVALANSGEQEGTVVFAESQTAGRGRKGNSWVSPPGENLLFSVLLRPEMPLKDWPRLAHAAGIAVVWGLQHWVESCTLQLKWPNDVYADGRKLAGILVESRSVDPGRSFAVMGVGINVNTPAERFPADLRQQITSVRDLANARNPLNRAELAGSILSELNRTYHLAMTDFEVLRREMEACSMLLGKEVRFQQAGRWQQGLVLGFGENGELQVRDTETGEMETVLSADLVRPL